MNKKPVELMSLAELKAEIKSFIDNKFDRDENYVFVSYSHYDQAVVMRKVCEWIRAGYNIYIDLDFENHGSEQNWVSMMDEMIRRSCCVQAVCFRSRHYYFSYASLIELLLLRSEHLAYLRQNNPPIPIEVIMLSERHQFGQSKLSEEDRLFEKNYKDIYNDTKNKLGNNRFFDDKVTEKEYLSYGLKSLLKEMNPDCEPDPAGAIRNFELKFSDGYKDFYPFIAYDMDNWFRVHDMNGNYKELNNSGTLNVFATHHVYNFGPDSDSAEKGPQVIPSGAKGVNDGTSDISSPDIRSGADYLSAVKALVEKNPHVIDNWRPGQIYSLKKENGKQQKECTLPDGKNYYVNLNLNISVMKSNYAQLCSFLNKNVEDAKITPVSSAVTAVTEITPVSSAGTAVTEITPVSSAVTAVTEYTVSETMMKYHVIQLGAVMDVGQNVDTVIVMNGHEYRSRSHNINKGRFDVQISKLIKENDLKLGEKLKATLDRAACRITLERI